ncbi:MAG: hypothetical protein E6I32_03865, partial [Chloroflexi bacterium]
SASEAARQEFPTLDATQRGTISIARRLQDPLAELVKIDPKAVGVGLYQHDVDQKELANMLDRVVVSCVNFAGVEVNSASAALLKHVSGINARVANAIVKYREEHGPFKTRDELQKVSGLGPTTFVQAAGFLKIANGKEPLDNTFIHPESYAAARALLNMLPADADNKGKAARPADRSASSSNCKAASAVAPATVAPTETASRLPGQISPKRSASASPLSTTSWRTWKNPALILAMRCPRPSCATMC